jgi:hypothetical protein
MENWWIWMSFWPSFNGMICRPWLFPIFSYIKHWLHWLRVKPAFVPSNEMFIRVYPFLYFLYGLRVQPLLKKTWPPSHETKWCGDKRGDISAILRVFPSGFPFGFSLRVPFGFPPMSSHQNSTGYWTGPLIFWSRFFMKTMSRRWKMLKVSTFAKCESPGMGC